LGPLSEQHADRHRDGRRRRCGGDRRAGRAEGRGRHDLGGGDGGGGVPCRVDGTVPSATGVSEPAAPFKAAVPHAARRILISGPRKALPRGPAGFYQPQRRRSVGTRPACMIGTRRNALNRANVTCYGTSCAACRHVIGDSGDTARLGAYGRQRQGQPGRPTPGPVHPRSAESAQGACSILWHGYGQSCVPCGRGKPIAQGCPSRRMEVRVASPEPAVGESYDSRKREVRSSGPASRRG
jgi:hypothetical protein